MSGTLKRNDRTVGEWKIEMYNYPLLQGSAKLDGNKKTYNMIGKIPNFYTEKVVGSMYDDKIRNLGTFTLTAGKNDDVSGSASVN